MHRARQQNANGTSMLFDDVGWYVKAIQKHMTMTFEFWHLPMDMRFSLFANLRLGCSGKSAGVFLVFPCKGGICKWSSSQIWSWALKGLFCNQLIKILVVVKHYAGRKPSASPGSYCHCHSFRVLFVHAFSLFRSHSGSQKSIASNSISLNLELNPPAISHELMLYHLVSVYICIQ